MSKKQWFILWLLFVGYLMLGATMFYNIERRLEDERRLVQRAKQNEIHDLLTQHIAKDSPLAHKEIIDRLTDYCGKPFPRINRLINETSHDNQPYTWTFYNSFFFSLTALSTIGYGNLSPSSNQGRVLLIFYSLIGIPFNIIVISQLGEFFSSVFLRAHHRYKNQGHETRLELIIDILIYLVPGVIVFLFAPAFAFQYFEDWSFYESIYYAFVTLTTIGFGDYVAGQSTDESVVHLVYKISLLIWIMFGLGYLVMILGFIGRAMKSKKINKLEHRLANTIKQTQSKLWNEFVQDVSYIRRTLNEVYLMKVKPVYRERKRFAENISQSCPNLSEWPVLRKKGEEDDEDEDDGRWAVAEERRRQGRRRAFSEGPSKLPPLQRVLSEGALGDIDVNATFNNPYDHPTLMRMSDVLRSTAGTPMDSEDDERELPYTFHGFPDEEILASEQYSTRTSGSWFVPAPVRSRAQSDVGFHYPNGLNDHKTWAGADSLHQLAIFQNMRERSGEWYVNPPPAEIMPPSSNKKKELDAKGSSGLRRLSMAALNFFTGGTNKSKRTSMQEEQKVRRSGNPWFKDERRPPNRRSLQEEEPSHPTLPPHYLTYTNGRRPSIIEMLTAHRGSNQSISPVLEQTSVADLLRVFSTLKQQEQNNSPTVRSLSGTPTGGREPPLQYLFQNPPQPRQLTRMKQDLLLSSGSLDQRQTRRGSTGWEAGVLRERRFSQLPPRGHSPEGSIFRRRASADLRIRGGLRFSNPPSGRTTPTPKVPPSLVVTGPEGKKHRFSVHMTPPLKVGQDASMKDSKEVGNLEEVVSHQ